jgi:hypothetical protein
MFNCLQVSRIKKNQKTRKDGEDEVVSETWVNDENDRFLTIRLLQTMERGSYPWIVVHHGVFQVLRAPLVLFIEDVDQIGRSVSVSMRDHCHRGDSCIKRKFVFQFHTETDAKIFTYAHNQTLLNHTRGRKVSPMPIKQEPESPGPPQKKRKRANEEDPLGSAMNPLKVEEELKSAMKKKFKRGDEHCNADDCHLETQDAWGCDSDL